MTWLRYVPHDRMLHFLALGWAISDELHGTNHGAFSVLMVWKGAGDPPNESPGAGNPAGVV